MRDCVPVLLSLHELERPQGRTSVHIVRRVGLDLWALIFHRARYAARADTISVLESPRILSSGHDGERGPGPKANKRLKAGVGH